MNTTNVGEATVSDRVKTLHRIEGHGLSLKAFVRKCLKDSNPDLVKLMKQWFKNKSHSGGTVRSDKNAQLAKTIGMAVKQSRSSKK